MDSKFFKEQICEELDGACDYIHKAIELRAMKTTWSDWLVEMSKQELSHAEHLYNMFKEYCEIQKKQYGGKLPYYIAEDWEEVASCYERKVADIKHLHTVIPAEKNTGIR